MVFVFFFGVDDCGLRRAEDVDRDIVAAVEVSGDVVAVVVVAVTTWLSLFWTC